MSIKIGMLVFPKGLITPQLFRVADVKGKHADLNPVSLGAVPQQSPIAELRRYRIRTTDEVSYNQMLVQVLRLTNSRSGDLYQYEVQVGDNVQVLPEYELTPHEGSLAPEPAEMLAQLDLAPWHLVNARTELLESFFEATSRSLGLIGYNGARMLPIPHQINAARYAIQFGRVRFLLADEVGLGKTIEAGLITATLRKYFSDWTTAIFVPESLTAQWAFEMYGKFGKAVFALEQEEYDPEVEAGVILPHYKAPAFAKQHSPEILIVDEAHRVLANPEVVKALLKLSEKAHAVLLLTATPVSDDSRNLLRLLQILDPEMFSDLNDPAQLRELQEKQGAIEEALKAIRAAQPEADAVNAAWKKTGIKDKEIERHLKAALAGEAPRHELHKMAALIVDRYYPGARIIRYRRKFLIQENPMPFRIFEQLDYKPTEEEVEVMYASRAWLDLVRKAELSEDPRAQQISVALLQAVHSSPLAVADWLSYRRGEMEDREGVTADPVLLALRANVEFKKMKGEKAALDALDEANQKWMKGVRAIDVGGRQLARSPRYETFLRFLQQTLKDEPDAHILVFTSFEANVHPLYLLVRKALQEVSETYEMFGSQSRVEREKAAFEFQEQPGGSILISDELGGEGRNFQFASHIVHFDLPLAPWIVEQRIGRCDRVGRDEELDVDSQVIVAKGQLDEAFCDFFADGIGVFNDSIAPVEGELDRIMQHVLKRCIEEGATGILEEIDPVAEELEEARERENAELLVRSAVGVEEARKIATALDDREELEKLRKAVARYARLFESMVDTQNEEGRTAITVGEFHSLHAVPGVRSEMVGFFGRKQAVRHERLEFFSPGQPFVRTLTQMAMTESPDRASVVRRAGLEEAAMLCSFRLSMPADFFRLVRDFPLDLQPPLLSRSAALFGTRMLRVAVTIDGTVIPNTEENAAYYAPRLETDVSLHEGEEDIPGLPPDWNELCIEMAANAMAAAEEYADIYFQERRADFEDMLVEAMTRVNASHDAAETEIDNIIQQLSVLTVDLDSAVFLIPQAESTTE